MKKGKATLSMNPDTPKDSPPQPAEPTKLPRPRWQTKLASLNGPQRVLALVATVMLALLATLAIYQAVNEEPTTTPAASSPALAQVAITPAGLTPSTITIKAGTQLTWTNQDSRSHQVAADPHPANSSIPGLESDTTLLAGDSLSFTFETKGTYSYHDHLNPLKKTYWGRVVVE